MERIKLESDTQKFDKVPVGATKETGREVNWLFNFDASDVYRIRSSLSILSKPINANGWIFFVSLKFYNEIAGLNPNLRPTKRAIQNVSPLTK